MFKSFINWIKWVWVASIGKNGHPSVEKRPTDYGGFDNCNDIIVTSRADLQGLN